MAIEATRVLRGLSRRDLARAIHAAVPRRPSEARRSPSYAEAYHRGMLLPRAFAAMEALGCRLCGWRSLVDTLTGLEDRRRPPRRRAASSSASSGSRTLLRDALASGDLWIEVDDVEDATFDEALATIADEDAVGVPATVIPKLPQSVVDDRVDSILERLDRIEGRLDGAGGRGRPRRSHVDAVEERLVALESRVLEIEARLRETPAAAHLLDPTSSDDRASADDLGGDGQAPLADPDPKRSGDEGAGIDATASSGVHDRPSIGDDPVTTPSKPAVPMGMGVPDAIPIEDPPAPADGEMCSRADDPIGSAPVVDEAEPRELVEMKFLAAQGDGRATLGLDPEQQAAIVDEELHAALSVLFSEYVDEFRGSLDARSTTSASPGTTRSTILAKDERDRRKKKQKQQRKQRKLARRR